MSTVWCHNLPSGDISFCRSSFLSNLNTYFNTSYRHTFWAVLIGNCTGAEMASFTCQQYKVQRYLSCKSLKESQKCVFISIISTALISILALFAGYTAYAYFEQCDPIKAEWVDSRDQIIPYLSLYMFGEIAPGVAGIYISAVFSASLSLGCGKFLLVYPLGAKLRTTGNNRRR